MTEAEKAAEAAKAEEAKKAAAAEEAKKAAGEIESEEDEVEDDKGETLESLKSKNAKLQEENKKRRLKEKETAAQLDRQNRALAILQGKEKADVDPILEAQKTANAKMSRALLKSSVVSAAKDAHDPALIFTAHANEFKDIEVDVDNETVDEDAVKERIEAIRKKSPFLFSNGTSQEGTQQQTVRRNPDRGGAAGGGGSEWKQWQALLGSGNAGEAQKFYNANRTKILTQIPSNKA